MDFGETDAMGQFLVTGAKNKHKIYLCDIQKPETSDKRYSSVTRKPKFTPSLDKKSTDLQTMNVADTKSSTSQEDKSYFQVKSCANLEGILLDISFVQKVVIFFGCFLG